MTLVDPLIARMLAILKPTAEVPLIIQHDGLARTRASELAGLGAAIDHVAWLVPQIHVRVAATEVPNLLASGVASQVWYDRPVYAYDRLGGFSGLDLKLDVIVGYDDVTKFVRSADLKATEGAEGAGAKIAVVDSGVDGQHPMLKDAVKDMMSTVDSTPTIDGSGHGTWVAGMACGRPTQYTGNVGGKGGVILEGCAPAADLYVAKIFGPDDSGTQSDLIQGIEWAVGKKVDVVNLSLGTDLGEGGLGPDARAVNAGAALGVRFAVAAGNAGHFGSIGSPGTAAEAVTVGSCAIVDPSPGALSGFSSKGPTILGRLKPDTVGPGGSYYNGSEGILGAGSGGDGFSVSLGTSMATPVVAGVMAQLVPLGLPADRGKLETIMAVGSRRGSWQLIKNPADGWGIVDAVGWYDAMKQGYPGIPVRNAIANLIGDRNFGLLGAAAAKETAQALAGVPGFDLAITRVV